MKLKFNIFALIIFILSLIISEPINLIVAQGMLAPPGFDSNSFSAHNFNSLFYFGGTGTADGNKALKGDLGNKGANLAEMTNLEMPVPPGYSIPNQMTRLYDKDTNSLPSDIEEMVLQGIQGIERRAEQFFGKKKVLGDANNPLFVSIRSGAKVSYPGEYVTLTKIGLHRTTLDAYARETGDVHRAYLEYVCHFMQDYSLYVLGEGDLSEEIFELIQKSSFGDKYFDGEYEKISDIAKLEELKQIADNAEKLFKKKTGKGFPEPREQIVEAVKAVINSSYGVSGAGCNVQAYVFGNIADGKSGSGVVFTRNPLNGEKGIYGSFEFNTEGKDVVGIGNSGDKSKEIHHKWKQPQGLKALNEQLPEVYEKLVKYAEILERHFNEIQDIEFTVQNGKLYLLQTRGTEHFMTPLAQVRTLLDRIDEGLISEVEALQKLGLTETLDDRSANTIYRLWWLKSYFEAPVLRQDNERQPIASGVIVLPGLVSAPIYTDWTRRTGKKGIVAVKKVIEYHEFRTVSPIALKRRALGALSVKGNFSDHITVRMRGSDKIIPYLTGIPMEINEKEGTVLFKQTGRVIKAGTQLIIDANNGQVYEGTLESSDVEDSEVTKVKKEQMNATDSTQFQYYEHLLQWIIFAEIQRSLFVKEKLSDESLGHSIHFNEEELWNIFQGHTILKDLGQFLMGDNAQTKEFIQGLQKTVNSIKETYQEKSIIQDKMIDELGKMLDSALSQQAGRMTVVSAKAQDAVSSSK